jgi:hypothetical protein
VVDRLVQRAPIGRIEPIAGGHELGPVEQEPAIRVGTAEPGVRLADRDGAP